jgi:hypothetical protein
MVLVEARTVAHDPGVLMIFIALVMAGTSRGSGVGIVGGLVFFVGLFLIVVGKLGGWWDNG